MSIYVVTGNEYEKEFKDSYIPVFKKLYFINRLIYSMLPVKNDDPIQKAKITGLIRNLNGIRLEIEAAFRPIIDRLSERASNPEIKRRVDIYKSTVQLLIDMSDRSRTRCNSSSGGF